MLSLTSLSARPSTSQLSSGHQLESSLQAQLSEKRQQVLDLERQMAAFRRELATLRGQLAASEEVQSPACCVPGLGWSSMIVRDLDSCQALGDAHTVRWMAHHAQPQW